MTYDFYPTNKQHHGKRAKTHDRQHAGGAKTHDHSQHAKARVVCDVHHDNGAFTLRCHPETHQKHKTHKKQQKHVHQAAGTVSKRRPSGSVGSVDQYMILA